MGRTATPTRFYTDHTIKKEENQEGVANDGELVLVYFSKTRRQMVSTPEKSPARQTQNDEPLPKVNWYLSHI
jgi:hypothetical protein